MAWLDRDRMPVRFTLVTSVTSGIIVGAILKLFSADIADAAVLIWFALTAAGAAAVVWVARLALRGARRRPARVFFMTSAFIQKYHVASFVLRLHNLLDRTGIDLVLKVPVRDYDASDQSHHLRRILDRRTEYTGGVIFAAEAHRLRGDLAAFCRNARLPIVFTDIEPFDENDYPDNTAYAGYDTGELGELAGRWLADNLRGRDRPRVLVIASREHAARQQRAQQALRSAIPDVDITLNDDCAFNRARAHDAARTHLRRLGTAQHLDAILCTNDEMALGAVDALPPTTDPRTTIVIGIDGVLEARALIDTGRSPLRATIVQDTERLACAVVDVLEKLHRGHPVPRRTILRPETHEAP